MKRKVQQFFLCSSLLVLSNQALALGYSAAIILDGVYGEDTSIVDDGSTYTTYSDGASAVSRNDSYFDGYDYDGFDPAYGYAAADMSGLRVISQHFQNPDKFNDPSLGPVSRITAYAGYSDVFSVTGNVDVLRFDYQIDGSMDFYGNVAFGFTANSLNGLRIEVDEQFLGSGDLFSRISTGPISIGADYNRSSAYTVSPSSYFDMPDPYNPPLTSVDALLSIFVNVDPSTSTADLNIWATAEASFGVSGFANTAQLVGVSALSGGIEVADATVIGEIAGDLSSYITTVPIPAAAWLFGSGLLGIIGIARRKKTN